MSEFSFQELKEMIGKLPMPIISSGKNNQIEGLEMSRYLHLLETANNHAQLPIITDICSRLRDAQGNIYGQRIRLFAETIPNVKEFNPQDKKEN